MKLPPVEYEAPRTVAEAIDLLAEHLDEASVLAGGQSLIPLLALRLARPAVLIDINGIGELSGVSATDGWVAIGAMTREYVAEKSEAVADAVPLLAAALPLIGHEAIRSRGTIGGSLAHADPAAELPAVARALDAEFVVRGPSGERVIPAAQWFEGYLTTSRRPDELLLEVRFPAARGGTGVSFQEVARRHGDFAIVGLAVSLVLSGGVISDARLAFPAFPMCRFGLPPQRICWSATGRRRSCSMRRPAARPRMSIRRATFTDPRTTARRSRPLSCVAACEQLRTTPAGGCD